jgi:hypothetical protein
MKYLGREELDVGLRHGVLLAQQERQKLGLWAHEIS